MGLFLFIDRPASVCGWVNFPMLWPYTPVQTKLKCPPPRVLLYEIVFISSDRFTLSDFNDLILGSENWTQAFRRSDFKVPFLLAPFLSQEGVGRK